MIAVTKPVTVPDRSSPTTYILRAEGALVLAASVTAYAVTGGGWMLFALLFLVPDLSMLGYLKNARAGAVVYNVGHSYLTVGALALVGWLADLDVMPVALIWVAHIGFDRMMGYGLKQASHFYATHLGWVGKAQITAQTATA